MRDERVKILANLYTEAQQNNVEREMLIIFSIIKLNSIGMKE